MPLTQYSTSLSKYDNHIIFHESINPSSTTDLPSRIFLLKKQRLKLFNLAMDSYEFSIKNPTTKDGKHPWISIQNLLGAALTTTKCH